MKRLLLITAASMTALAPAAPAFAAFDDVAGIAADDGTSVYDRQGRGRGRGRGGDDGRHGGGDDADGSDDDNGSGSGRDRPRVPGGSGCDDAGDVAEHAGCGG